MGCPCRLTGPVHDRKPPWLASFYAGDHETAQLPEPVTPADAARGPCDAHALKAPLLVVPLQSPTGDEVEVRGSTGEQCVEQARGKALVAVRSCDDKRADLA